MPLNPTRILLAAAVVVGAGAWSILAAITSGLYADTHHPVVWSVALVLNLVHFLIPAAGVWLAARNRWAVGCSIAISAWSVFYLASLFWLFPATDGP